MRLDGLGGNRDFLIVGLHDWGWRIIALRTGERSGVLSRDEVSRQIAADSRLGDIEIVPVDVARKRLRSRRPR